MLTLEEMCAGEELFIPLLLRLKRFGYSSQGKQRVIVQNLAFGSTQPRYKDSRPSRLKLSLTKGEATAYLSPVSYRAEEATNMEHRIDRQPCSIRGRYFGAASWMPRVVPINEHQVANPAPCDYAKETQLVLPKHLRRYRQGTPPGPLPVPRVPRFPRDKSFSTPGPGWYYPERARIRKEVEARHHLGRGGREVIPEVTYRCTSPTSYGRIKCMECGKTPTGSCYWSAPKAPRKKSPDDEDGFLATDTDEVLDELILCYPCRHTLARIFNYHITMFLSRFKKVADCRRFHYHAKTDKHMRLQEIYELRGMKRREAYLGLHVFPPFYLSLRGKKKRGP